MISVIPFKNQAFKKNIAGFAFMTMFFVTVIIVYYHTLSTTTKARIIKECEANAVESSGEIDKYLVKGVAVINTIEGSINNMISDRRSSGDILEYLVDQSKAVVNILPEATTGIYGYINGEYLDGDGWVPDDDYDPTKRPWYIEARANTGRVVVVDPYLDAQTGQIIITLAKELCDAKSVVAFDLSLKELQNITERITGENETIMVLDRNYYVIAHSDREEINRDYKIQDGSFGNAVVSAYEKTEEDSFRVTYNNTEYIVYSTKLDNNWIGICATDATDAYRALRTPFIITIVVSVIIAGFMITSLVYSEQRRHLTEQLEEEKRIAVAANNAKTTFLANMSHEIRTPINAILGMNEMVLRECGDENILKYSMNIKTAGDSLLGLVNDLLDFSRIESGRATGSRNRFTAPSANILVADDNPINLEVFKSLIRRTLVVPDTADSGDACISMTADKKYDLIFLDHMMPEKDGIETMAQIRGDNRNPNIETPVVCLTANATSGAREFYLDAGFNDYMTKPIDPESLEDMMVKYLPDDKITFFADDTDAGTSENAQTPAKLDAIKELSADVDAGIALSGSIEDYMMLLQIFREVFDDRSQELERLFSDKDYKNYTIKIHALKSSLLLIGAKTLADAAQELENAGKSGDYDYIVGNHALFMGQYGKLKEPLDRVFAKDSGEDDDKPVAGAQVLDDAYEALRTAAAEMDCDRLEEIMNELGSYRIPQEHSDRIKQLNSAVRNYEYDSILSILDDITEKAEDGQLTEIEK